MQKRSARVLGVVVSIVAGAGCAAVATECCDPKGPFRLGEGTSENPATCETLQHWADKAPDIVDRVTMVVRGKLSDAGSNGTLAYLEMCDPKQIRVVCVTYKLNGMRAGDVVTFAGGFRRSSTDWVMLDPCLASR